MKTDLKLLLFCVAFPVLFGFHKGASHTQSADGTLVIEL